MQQLALFSDTAREAAKNFIRAYVYRGSSLEFLSNMGASSPGSYNVFISGYLGTKRYSNDKILVARDMNGKVVNKVFSKVELYEEVKKELTSGSDVKVTPIVDT